MCVCDLPWLRVSWLVRNDRLTLSRTPSPTRPTPLPYPTHPSALERRQIFRPVLCVYACVCACARACQPVQFCHCLTGCITGGAQENSRHAFVASIISASVKAKAGLALRAALPFDHISLKLRPRYTEHR